MLTNRRRSRSKTVALISLGIVLVLPSMAHALPSSVKAPRMTFERDSTGGKPNGFTSADSSIAHFSDSSGSNLSVNDFSPATIGNGLIIGSDDGSKLIIDFDVPDQEVLACLRQRRPRLHTDPGDIAVIEVFQAEAWSTRIRS